MLYKILPTKEFEKDFRKLEKNEQHRIKAKIEEVSQNPERYKHLQYELKGSCRIRMGKLRVIYSYDAVKEELYLENVVFDHAYRNWA